MSQPVLIIFIGFIYVLMYGGMSYLRHEGLSLRFAVEGIFITLVFCLLAWVGVFNINPLIFIIILYMVTMRVRWLVDLASFFAKKGRFTVADQIFDIAFHSWPDKAGMAVIEINRGVSFIQQKKYDDAILVLKKVIRDDSPGNIGVKFESAAHYNLAVAYQRTGNDALSIIEFNVCLDIWPISEYARRASQALSLAASKRKEKGEDILEG
jgi:tetratricopeptide (TPR) repeat protein